ncbi:MAG: HD domain-containing protein [Patescibacteria group bacterium]
MKISKQAEFILETLEEAGYEAYIVGGAVRDLLLDDNNQRRMDYDFATNAEPEKILEIFPESFYENDFGTVMITEEDLCKQAGLNIQYPISNIQNKSDRLINLANASKIHESLPHPSGLANSENQSPSPLNGEGLPNYEITTYRSKELYSNFRKPEKLEWGETIEEDLQRRDFTINAMALGSDLRLVDPFSGQKDLEKKLIRAVGDPHTRFQEDALRMLRAIRFSVELNMQIDDDTFAAIKNNADLIRNISWERIRDELLKMLASNYPAEAIELLEQTNLLADILPELLEGKRVEQGGHHNTDVWTHSLDALRYCPSFNPIVRLATLLHDIAKPRTKKIINGNITFYNHEIIGSRMAKKIARRFKLSKYELDQIFILVRYHMFYYQPQNTDASIRRFMRKVGLENIDDILDLREADRLGSGARKTSWRLEEMKQRMIEQLHQPMDTRDLAINGHDLMKEFNLKPGPILGEIMQNLLEKVLDKPELNTKEKLLTEAKKLL